MKTILLKHGTLISILTVLFVSYLTLYRHYEEPSAFFWDENYHIAAAQKYLHGVFFMEPHPPLGKLLIAAGEYLFPANPLSNQFLDTDHASNPPKGFLFSGYRFFPALLAAFCPLLLFLVVRSFTSVLPALFAALLFAFDNALIVHLRGAMLEGTQLFFILAYLLVLTRFLKQISADNSKSNWGFTCLAILAGVFAAAVMTTKLNGIVLIIPTLPCLWIFHRHDKLIAFVLNSGISFLASFILVWSIHISLGAKINPKLPDSGYYQASIPYRVALQKAGGSSIGFFSKLQDHLAFLPHYTKGVPEMNFCKKEENGSPWYWWIVGGKSISYRWDKSGELTYMLYLVANPVGWALSFAGVLLAAIVFGSQMFFKPIVGKKTYVISTTLFMSWIFYIALFGNLGRVMYLYHYFIPLVLGWLMLALLTPTVSHIGQFSLSARNKAVLMIVFLTAEICSYLFFSPFTYASALTNKGIQMRSWLKIWDIHCPSCESINPLARPVGDPKRDLTPKLSISGLVALETYQEWGEPVMNQTVQKEKLVVAGREYDSGLGVHAESRVVFATSSRYRHFEAKVAMPDYIAQKSGGSVIFKVVGDGRTLWNSEKISAGMEAVGVSLHISGIERLSLIVEDAGDGNTDDHAIWLEPRFE